MERMIVLLFGLSLLVHGQDLREALLRCGRIPDDLERLAAFDQVARESAEGKVQVPEQEENSQPVGLVREGPPPVQQPPAAPVPQAQARTAGPFGIEMNNVLPGKGKWRTTSSRSPMDDKRTYIAFLYSEERVDAGTQGYWPALNVRHGEGKLEVYITYGETLPAERVRLALRLGKAAPFDADWLTSTDFKAAFFPGDPRPFLEALCRESKLVVRVIPYGANARTVTFDVRGLPSVLYSMSLAVENER
ncbi:MAG: hypothetical protein RBU25_09245 [Lentisphaeria bacterium]|jgi:hypothetical protein|nr:hypothetical protein [Lentisphaeria bacterium]